MELWCIWERNIIMLKIEKKQEKFLLWKMYIYEKSKNENEIKESAYAYQDEQNGISVITTNSIAIPDILLIVIKQKWTW